MPHGLIQFYCPHCKYNWFCFEEDIELEETCPECGAQGIEHHKSAQRCTNC